MAREQKERNGKWKRRPSKHTNIRLALPLRERLEAAAERSDRTISSMGAECIRRALDEIEGVHSRGAEGIAAGSAAV